MAETTQPDLRRDFVKVLLVPALSLLVLPLLAWAFTGYAVSSQDARFVTLIAADIDKSNELPEDQKALAKAFYEANPPSVACSSTDPELAKYREGVCSPGDDMWQFVQARRAAIFSFVLGVVGLLGALVLGVVVWRVPRLQYASFMVGWAGLSLMSGVEVLVQGVLSTWMSYWVTALFMHIYVPKLILVMGIVAAIGVWTALRGIFRRVRFTPEVEGELVTKEDGPALWGRLMELASKVGTPAPATVIAGIDDNFFVTEAKLRVGQREVEGRSLFVSIPLLRVLSASEADAVLAHELAHFRGGDTSASARLSPALTRYDTYLGELQHGFLTLPAFYVMRMFRAVFEFARQKEKRERELIADRVASQTTSADDVARSLLKVMAYSSHRSATEKELFEKNEKHTSSLALKDRVASGLGAHVATVQFRENIATASVPHPFDSHPPLADRLKNVGSPLTANDCEHLLKSAPTVTWADQLPTATAIEDRLWAAYEARFADAHEMSLAYRYLPEGDEQRAVVEKFFPAKSFVGKDGVEVRLTYAFIEVAGVQLPWRDVYSASIDDGNFATYLQINHRSGSDAGPGPTKVNLRKHAEAEQLKADFGAYWQRDTAARDWVVKQRVKESLPATETGP